MESDQMDVDETINESFKEILARVVIGMVMRNKNEIFTIERAKEFLKNFILDYHELYGELLPKPFIVPGIDGDIDLEWDNDDFYLLLSVPKKENDLIGAYGEIKRNGSKIRLDFDVHQCRSLTSLMNIEF